MVEFDGEGPAFGRDTQRLVESTVGDAQIVQSPQGRAREEAEFRVIAFGLKFAYDNDGDDDFMLRKAGEGTGISQQNAGI